MFVIIRIRLRRSTWSVRGDSGQLRSGQPAIVA
jgi:hypothetical protein